MAENHGQEDAGHGRLSSAALNACEFVALRARELVADANRASTTAAELNDLHDAEEKGEANEGARIHP